MAQSGIDGFQVVFFERYNIETPLVVTAVDIQLLFIAILEEPQENLGAQNSWKL